MKNSFLLVVAIITFSKVCCQIPNTNNEKVVCTWLNGCNDPKACCKIVKGGESFDNTTFKDASGNQIQKCSKTVTTNCIECIDLSASYNMGSHHYIDLNYDFRYNMSGMMMVTNEFCERTIFDMGDYSISDSGRVLWYNAISNIVTIYTAESSILGPLFYRPSTLDSVKIDLDTLCGGSGLIPDNTLDILKAKWLNSKLNITIAPNPASQKFSILTESSHPAIVATTDLILELYTSTGTLISAQKINANGKWDFIVPQNYSSSYLVYKITWGNSFRRGLIGIISTK